MIRPAGLGTEGFDESKIPEAKNLRAQVEVHLQDQKAEAENKVEKAAQQSLDIPNKSEKREFLQTAQEEIDDLFEKSGVRDLLPPGKKGDAFYAQLKGEWSEQHNVQNRADSLAEQANKSQLPKPEDIARKPVRGAAPPPAAEPPPPAAPPPSAPTPDGDFAEIFRKLMEELQRAGGGGVAPTSRTAMRGSGLSPEVRETVLQWHHELDSGKKQLLFEKLKAALGGTSKEAQSQSREENLPDLLNQIEAAAPARKAAPAPSLFGAEAPAPLQATPPPLQSAAPPTLQAGPAPPIPNIATMIHQCLFQYYGWDTKYPLHRLLWDNIISPAVNNNPGDLLKQIQAIRTGAENAIRNNAWEFNGAPWNQLLAFRIFTFSTCAYSSQEIAVFNTPELQARLTDATKYAAFTYNMFDWACKGADTVSQNSRLALLNKLLMKPTGDVSTGFEYKFYFDLINSFNSQDDTHPERRTFDWFQGEVFRVFFTDNPDLKIGNRINPYFAFPGLSYADLKDFCTAAGYSFDKIPPEMDIDRAYRAAFVYLKSFPEVGGQNFELAKAIVEELNTLEKAGTTGTAEFIEWARGIWSSTNPPSWFTSADAVGKAKFVELTKYSPVEDLRSKINSWGSTGPELAFRAALLKLLDGCVTPSDFQKNLNAYLAGKDIYLMFPGLRDDDNFKALFQKLGVPMPTASDLDHKLMDMWKWKETATNPEEKDLATWLFNKIVSIDASTPPDPTKNAYKISNFNDFIIKVWTDPALFNEKLKDASFTARLSFIQNTGYDPLAKVTKDLNDWAKNPAQKAAVATLVDYFYRHIGQPLSALQETLKGFFTQDLYFTYPGLSYDDAIAIAGKLGVDTKDIPKPTDLQLKLIDAVQNWLWKTTANTPDNRLAQWFCNLIPTCKDVAELTAKVKALWMNPTADLLDSKLTKTSLDQLQRISGFDPNAFFKAAFATLPDSAKSFRDALFIMLMDTSKGNAAAFILEMRKMLTDPRFYVRFPTLTVDILNNFRNKIGVAVIPERPQNGLEKIYVQAFQLAQDPTKSAACKELFAKICTMITSDPKLTEATVKPAIQDMWTKTYQANFWTSLTSLTGAEATLFRNLTDVNIGPTRLEVQDAINKWSNAGGGPEKAFATTILADLAAAKDLDAFKKALGDKYFNLTDPAKSVYRQFLGLTTASIDSLCKALNITRPPPKDASYAESQLAEAYKYVTFSTPPVSEDAKKLFKWLTDLLVANPKVATQAEFNTLLTTQWAKDKYETTFYDVFKNISAAEVAKFQALTNLPIQKSLNRIIDNLNEALKTASPAEKRLIEFLIGLAKPPITSVSAFIAKINAELATGDIYYRFLDRNNPDGGLTHDKLYAILGIIGTVGPDKEIRPKPDTDMDKLLWTIANHLSGLTGPAKELYTKIYQQILDQGKGWPLTALKSWWDTNFFNSKTFWTDYPLSDAEAAFFTETMKNAQITLPPKPPPPPPPPPPGPLEPAEKAVNNYLTGLEAVWKALNDRFYHYALDLKGLANNDSLWRNVVKTLGKRLDQLVAEKRISQTDANSFAQVIGRDRNNTKLYFDVQTQIQELKAKKPPGTLNDLIKWIDDNLPNYPGVTDDDKKKLLDMIQEKLG